MARLAAEGAISLGSLGLQRATAGLTCGGVAAVPAWPTALSPLFPVVPRTTWHVLARRLRSEPAAWVWAWCSNGVRNELLPHPPRLRAGPEYLEKQLAEEGAPHTLPLQLPAPVRSYWCACGVTR
jgi:hypothetical protein